jgi:hypothetical protein
MEINSIISIGEAMDKLSILDIKKLKITNSDKLSVIQNEIDKNNHSLKKYTNSYLYSCLIIINTYIHFL